MKQWIDLAPEEAQKFGREQVTLKHNMADSGLFTDEALAELIDRYPREYYMLTTR